MIKDVGNGKYLGGLTPLAKDKNRERIEKIETKIIDIESKMEHETAELICIICHYRYHGVFPTKTYLQDLECPKCSNLGGIILTGQKIFDR